MAALASDLGVVGEDAASTVDYARDGRPFAVVDGSALELRMNPEVAVAAARTTFTTASRRGNGWIRFAPPSVDQFVLDRAEAWFLSAWRVAEGEG